MERKTRRKNPIAPAIALAALAAFLWFVGRPMLIESLPSREQADLAGLLGIPAAHPDYVAIVLDGQVSGERARQVDGAFYVRAEFAQERLNRLFYANAADGCLLLTDAEEVVRADLGAKSYTLHAEGFGAGGAEPETVETPYAPFRIIGGEPCVALDYAKLFANFTYEAFASPPRISMATEWEKAETARAKRWASVREGADIKSPLIRELAAGETVTVQDKGEDWSLVMTSDALIGFVENRRLSGFSESAPAPVTSYAPPPYTSLASGGKICLAWHQVGVRDANPLVWEMLDGTEPINTISPTWYSIADSSGALSSLASKEYVDAFHARGIAVWPLVNDFTKGLDRHALLSSWQNRHTFITNLVREARDIGFDGVNLDFETVPTDDGEHFTQLLRELSVACRQAGLVFSVDNYVPRAHTAHYNRAVQGEVADYVVIMGYDEHYDSHIGIGPVASIGFVEDGIKKTLEEVPAEKTINAVPFYTRIWVTHADGSTDSTAVGQKTQREWVEKRGLVPEWDEALGMNYVEYEEKGTRWQVWLEDADSMQRRIDAMEGYGLAGVAGWRLGLQSPELWEILRGYAG